MSVWTIIAITASTAPSGTGRRSASARAHASLPRAYRSMPAETSTPTGVQPSTRTLAACTPVPQPISRQIPSPVPSRSRRERSTPSGSSAELRGTNSVSYQSAIRSYAAGVIVATSLASAPRLAGYPLRPPTSRPRLPRPAAGPRRHLRFRKATFTKLRFRKATFLKPTFLKHRGPGPCPRHAHRPGGPRGARVVATDAPDAPVRAGWSAPDGRSSHGQGRRAGHDVVGRVHRRPVRRGGAAVRLVLQRRGRVPRQRADLPRLGGQ